MSIATVVTRGFGSFSVVNFLPPRGYGNFTAPPAEDRAGGRIVAGWFSKKKWHNLRKEIDEQERLERLQAAAQARLEAQVDAEIAKQRGFSRKVWNQLEAERIRGQKLAARRRELDAQAAEAARIEEAEAAHAALLARIADAQAETQRLLHSMALDHARSTHEQTMIAQRLAEQRALHAELIRQAQEEEDDILAFLSLQ